MAKRFLIAVGAACVAMAGMLGGVDAQAQGFEVSKRDCERLNRRNANVSADYQAGVDVRGNKVKGADVDGGSPIQIPKDITIPIGVDIAEKYGLDDKGVSASAAIGTVKVKGNKVYYNGKRLGGGEEDAIKRACAATYASP